jgi:alpha-L-fucosidase
MTFAAGQTERVIDELGPRLASIRPSERQLAWQQMEFYAFVHFGMNTMTGREWGLGHEDPVLFDPSDLDVDGWMTAIASAGMTGVILTAKHHDGFCLWPSRATKHTVAASPWQSGRGDLVRQVAEAAARHDLRLGIYVSPWDRTEATYGTGNAYDDFFVEQLTELLSDYGQVFSVWFDGANGEGANGKHQVYDWDRYYRVIRKLQPDAVISVCGPDVRWCGNEAGQTRSDEWSVVPAGLRDVERIADDSQHEDDGEFARLVRSDEDDLGSRSALRGHLDDLVWYPAEVNTSIRPGWFYHRDEDDQVRSAEELMGIWYSSVGGNACFLLNVPPNAAGRTSEPDADVLDELGVLIADYSARRVSTTVTVSSGVVPEGFGSAADAPGIPWEPTADDARPTVVLHFERPMAIEAIEVREDIRTGQRIEDLVVVGKNGDEAFSLGSVHAVGHRRILRFEPRILDAARLEIRGSRAVPRLLAVTAVAAR